jgi:hypothetical protein
MQANDLVVAHGDLPPWSAPTSARRAREDTGKAGQ